MKSGGQWLLELCLFLQSSEDLLQLSLLGADEVQLAVQSILLALGSLHCLVQLSDLYGEMSEIPVIHTLTTLEL